MNKCERLKAELVEMIAGIKKASPANIEIKDIGPNSQMLSNTKNLKQIRLDYLPNKGSVIVEDMQKRTEWDIPETPLDEMAYRLIQKIT